MRLTHLLNLALVTAALAGCGQTAINALPAGRTATATQAMSLPNSWTDLSKLSTPDDPATLPGAPTLDVGTEPVPGLDDLVRFAKVDDKLYRGGLPSKAHLAAMKKMGIKTDIDLMGEIPVYDSAMVLREKAWAKSVGINFVQVKVPTGSIPFGKKVSQEIANQFLKVALDPANQPCYVHCLHGRDRTGTMSAVYRMTVNGFTPEKAYAEMKSFGFDEKHYPTLAAFVKAYQPTPAAVAAAR